MFFNGNFIANDIKIIQNQVWKPNPLVNVPLRIGGNEAADHVTQFNHMGYLFNCHYMNCLMNSEEMVQQLMIEDVVGKQSIISKFGLLSFSMCEQDISSNNNKNMITNTVMTLQNQEQATLIARAHIQHEYALETAQAQQKLIIVDEKIPFQINTCVKVAPSNFISCFEGMFGDETMSDLTLQLPHCSKHGEYKVHKCILVARCATFKALLLTCGMVETTQSLVQLTTQASSETFYEFLKFLYCDTVQLNEENAVELLFLADEYDVVRLKDMAEQFICGMVSVENVCFLHTLPLSCHVLKFITSMFLKENIEAVKVWQQENDQENQYQKLIQDVWNKNRPVNIPAETPVQGKSSCFSS